MANQMDRNDYSVSASQAAQANFETVAGQLEAALDRRDVDVKAAMAEYYAEGVSEEYSHLERQWNDSGRQVRQIIAAVRQSLGNNDDIAVRAGSTARSHIPT